MKVSKNLEKENRSKEYIKNISDYSFKLEEVNVAMADFSNEIINLREGAVVLAFQLGDDFSSSFSLNNK